ncbi:concanavalin A-like lectin/glucanase domain-containing protein [Entophlyctis helioformis]|nr:concanavalin A-like lectin/glucanase domain-containing protein [Entophlyctis helioformis]
MKAIATAVAAAALLVLPLGHADGPTAAALFSSNSLLSQPGTGVGAATVLWQTAAIAALSVAASASLPSVAAARMARPEGHATGKTSKGDTLVDRTHARFDYRMSFKQPYFLQNTTIPYFNTSGDAVAGHQFIRLAMGMPYRRGAIWSAIPNKHPEWKVEMSFFVSGHGVAGGDGMVLWYTEGTHRNGPMDFYGHSSKFKGIAIVFDTSDLPNERYNPFVYGLANDGTKSLEDFKSYLSSQVNLGACYREYRNSPGPVFVRLSYIGGILSLDIDVRQGGNNYVTCFVVPHANLPTGYHFGISAATGENDMDDHDVLSFETYELNPKLREHKNRPFEEEEIAKGRKFKMDDSLQKEIERAEEKVRKLKEKEEGLSDKQTLAASIGFTPESIVKIEENQFRMIEALNLIEQKLGQPPTQHAESNIPKDIVTNANQGAFETRLNTKFDNIKSEVDGIREEIRGLTRTTRDLAQVVHNLLGQIDSKVGQAKKMIEETHETVRSSPQEAARRAHEMQTQGHTSALFIALYIFAGIAGLGLVSLCFGVYTRSKNKESKKFI